MVFGIKTASAGMAIASLDLTSEKVNQFRFAGFSILLFYHHNSPLLYSSELIAFYCQFNKVILIQFAENEALLKGNRNFTQ